MVKDVGDIPFDYSRRPSRGRKFGINDPEIAILSEVDVRVRVEAEQDLIRSELVSAQNLMALELKSRELFMKCEVEKKSKARERFMIMEIDKKNESHKRDGIMGIAILAGILVLGFLARMVEQSMRGDTVSVVSGCFWLGTFILFLWLLWLQKNW